jgi:arylsulfatase A-like enzyme
LIAALLALAAACGGRTERSPEEWSPNVLIVSIDTLRADRLGCYGYERDTTPALDRLARERAVRFTRAVAEAPWTLPSHVTMLSGLHPLTHGVRRPGLAPPDEVVLLAERLRDSHYSFAITDGVWLSEQWGFARGFDSFHARDQDIDRAVEQVLEYVRHRRDKGPWFGFLHTYDVHCPYDPPPPYAGRFASSEAEPIEVAGRCGNPHFNSMQVTPGQARFLSDRYDEDLRRVDDALAVLFAGFDALELWKDTVVIVTSDHGEEFLEHGRIGHERTLSEEVLSIPLLVAAPGLAPRVVEEVVGLADLVPTVLELVGAERVGRFDGRSLVPILQGGTDAGRQGWVLSDLAWQAERVARTTRTGRDEIEPIAMVVDAHGLLKLRAEMLAAGYNPRPVDPDRHAADLRALGY